MAKQRQIRKPESKKGQERIAKFKKTDIQNQLMCAMTPEEFVRKLLEIIDNPEEATRHKLDAMKLFAQYAFPKPTTQNVTISADANKKLEDWVKGNAIQWEDTDKDVIDIS